MRRLALALLLVAGSGGLVAGCGQSDEQKRAIEVNDTIDTTQAAAEAEAQKALAEENEKLDDQDRKDRKGLAKDLVDAVGGAADQAADTAKKQGDQATEDALTAAQRAVDKAADAAQKARDDVSKSASEAVQDAFDQATSPSP